MQAIFEGQVGLPLTIAGQAAVGSSGVSGGNGTLLVEGQQGTSIDQPLSPLETLEDMTAFVERTRVEEESIRRKREEVELQLLRMRQQEAVRRQQAMRMRVATDRANAAVLRDQQQQPGADGGQQPGASAGGGGAGPGPGSSFSGSSSSSSGEQLGGPGGGPGGKRKMMMKKSKRMSAVAAASGLHRVASSPAAPASSRTSGGDSGPLGAGASSASTAAMLSREDLIQRHKGGANGGGDGAVGSDAARGHVDDDECDVEPHEVVVPKPVFIISDCTGESAARTVRAALNQFELRCRTEAPAQIMVFRFVEHAEKVANIIKEAAKEDALVVYTLVDPKMVKAVQTACGLYSVRYVDLWTALLDSMEVHLNALRRGVPSSLLSESRPPRASLTEEYFKMIEAVEYTRKMDDGANPKEWGSADLLILGVSRCGKTPLSIYLGQRGYKVANLPLVPGLPLPKELFEIDQRRIVGLIIDPQVLSTIRRNRVNMLGVSRAQSIDYAELQKVNQELEWARKLYNAHSDWPVLDVTLRGIEETAARILKILNDRRGASSPQWVDSFHAKERAAAAAAQQRDAAQQSGLEGLGPEVTIPELVYGNAVDSSYLMQGLY